MPRDTANYRFKKYEVKSQSRYCDGVYLLSIKRPFDFKPGEVCAIKSGPNQPWRLYSIASGSSEKELSFLYNVVQDGALTPRLEAFYPGQDLWISIPGGNFILPNENAVFIATGTGIAPFRSRLKSGPVKNITLIHGARTREHLYDDQFFRETLGNAYVPCCSRDTGGAFFPGRLTQFLEQEELDPTLTYYLCGSPEMVTTVRELLISKQIPFNHIISEIYF